MLLNAERNPGWAPLANVGNMEPIEPDIPYMYLPIPDNVNAGMELLHALVPALPVQALSDNVGCVTYAVARPAKPTVYVPAVAKVCEYVVCVVFVLFMVCTVLPSPQSTWKVPAAANLNENTVFASVVFTVTVNVGVPFETHFAYAVIVAPSSPKSVVYTLSKIRPFSSVNWVPVPFTPVYHPANVYPDRVSGIGMCGYPSSPYQSHPSG